MLRNCITGSYYGIILQNDIMELYYRIMKRIPRMPRTSHELPWDPGDPLGPPLGPPGTPMGPQGTPLGPPGDVPETPQGRPWNPQEPPGTSYGPQKAQ